MGKTIRRLLVALSLSAALLSGCSALPSSTPRNDTEESVAVGAPEAPGDKGAPDYISTPGVDGAYTPNLVNEQKLIRRGSITLTAKSIETAQEEIRTIASRYNGYVYAIRQSQTQEQRYLEITIKVQNTRFEEALKDIEALGTASNISMDVSDVTREFIDTETRIKTLKVKEQTLVDILAKATKIEDIILLENSLQETRQQIESYEGQLNALKNATEYSTITVSVRDAEGLAKSTEPIPPGDRFRDNLSRGLRYWSNVAIDGVSGFLFLLPVIIPLAALLLVFLLLRRRFPSKRRRRSEELQQRLYSKTGGVDNPDPAQAEPPQKAAPDKKEGSPQ